MTECEHSPTGKHEWKVVEEDRTRPTDWGCVPGTYCLYCDKRKEDDKMCGPYDDWPSDVG